MSAIFIANYSSTAVSNSVATASRQGSIMGNYQTDLDKLTRVPQAVGLEFDVLDSPNIILL